MAFEHYAAIDPEILDSFRVESVAGAAKYGGEKPVEHDLSHSLVEWVRFASDHLDRALVAPPQEAAAHLKKVGGLMLSAVRAFERGGCK